MERVSYDLTGDRIVITGANGKLGSYYARLLKAHGASVIGLDVNITKSIIDDAKNDGIYLIECDISDKDQVKTTFESIRNSSGLVSGLINNAAAGQTTFVEGDLVSFEEFPIEVWVDNLNVNLTGAFLCCQQAGKHMDQQNGLEG